MRKTNHVWKRLLSLALALVMLLGYVPAKASAEEVQTGTLLTAEITVQESNSDSGAEVTKYTYTIKVTDKNGTVVTDNDRTDITWTGAEEGFTGPTNEATYGPTTSGGDAVSATVTYNGLKLTDVKVGTSTWSATIAEWGPFTAGDTVTPPTINPDTGASFDTDPVWTITSADGAVIASGTVATVAMGQLTAKVQLSGQEFIETTTVQPATVTVAAVEPADGWKTAAPDEVTVYGTSSVSELADIDNTSISIAEGQNYTWVKSSKEGYQFEFSFTPTVGTTYTIGGNSYTWNVDSTPPAVTVKRAYVTKDNETKDNKTIVNYDYRVGASGGTLYVNDTPYKSGITPGASGNDTLTIDGELDKVTLYIQNGAGVKSEESSEDVSPKPTDIELKGDCYKKDEKIFIKQGGTITFVMVRAVQPTCWNITNENSESIKENECSESTSYSIEISDNFKSLTVNASDAYERTLKETFGTFELDSKSPEIQIDVTGTNGTVDTPHVTNSWECQISVTDNVKVESASALLTYVDKEGNETTKIVELATAADQQPSKISLDNIDEGVTLTKISVTAADWAGNTPENAEVTPYVTKDTKAPEIIAKISAKDENGNEVKIKNIFEFDNVTYLVLDPAVEDGNEVTAESPTVTVEVTYTLNDAQDGETESTNTITVKRDEVVAFDLNVTVKDKAGNTSKAEQVVIQVGDGDSAQIILTPTYDTAGEYTGEYTGSVTIDRRAPEDAGNAGAPTVSLGLENDDDNYPGVGGLRRFKSNITFTMNVTDSGSGLPLTDSTYKHSVTYEVGETTETKDVLLNADGTGSVTIPVAEGIEDESCSVTLTISDNVGNRYIYHENFAVDSKAPVVTIDGKTLDEFTLPESSNEKNKKLTLHMDDLYPDYNYSKVTLSIKNDKDSTRTKDHEVKLEEDKTDVTFGFADGDQLTKITISAADQLGNETTPEKEMNFVYDVTPPEIEIEVTAADPADSDDLQKNDETSDGVIYYSHPVRLTVTISDDYMLDMENCFGSYKIKGADKTLDCELYWELDNEDAPKKAKATIPRVDAGKLLSNLTVHAEDKAANKKEIYGNNIAVDSDNPQVTVAKELVDPEKKFIQTVNGTDYYNGEVKFTFTVTDQFIDPDSTVVTAQLSDDTEKTWETTQTDPAAQPLTSLTGTIVLEDGETLTGITVVAKDRYGRNAEKVKTDGEDYTFAEDAENPGTFHYEGNSVVVDMTHPEATLKLSSNVQSVQLIQDTYYVTLKNKVAGENGSFEGEEKEQVTLTLTVTDDNLMLQTPNGDLKDDTFPSVNIDGKEWALNGNTATLTATVAVPINDSALLTIDAKAFDLAGNPMVIVSGSDESDDKEEKTVEIKAKSGVIQGTFSIDRRTPSSTEDIDVPEIELLDNGATKVKTLSGMDLYGADFNFSVYVTDKQTVNDTGNEEKYYAGLKEVVTDLSDAAGAVFEAGKTSSYAAEVHRLDHREDISVSSQGGETDEAVLEITATDNVGNTIKYSKNFAFDDLAPRITVNVSGTSVRGNKYYNQTRTATVTIEDLHMPEIADFGQYVTVTTQGTGSGWVKNGNVYTNTYTFADDGEYTFSIQARDLLGNTTYDSGVTYTGENPRDFVVDKTQPVITVIFTPATPDGRDNRNVVYYAENVTATATITEKNFSAADVAARIVGGNYTFGGWTGDLAHRSSVTFGEGNNYSFTIDYMDLAGNRAQTYTSNTFSVDLTAPEITISKGSLSNDGLNIVQGDLSLALTIHDGQQNLSNYTVTVTRLNNNFKSEEVSGNDFYVVTTEEERTTVVVDFNAIAKEKGNDGIYTVKVSATDYAGNTVELTPELQFSLNRFGSTFTTNDKFTEEFLTLGQYQGAYHNSVDSKLVIQEINPNMVWQDSSKKKEGSTLTVVVNGTSTQLEEGKQYTMTRTKEGAGENSWYVYTYEIDPDAFCVDGAFVDGRYSILLYGEDDAGNKNTNESNENSTLQKNAEGVYTGKVEFILDTTPPIITTTGVEDGVTYNEEFRRMNIFLSDNTPYQIAVYLNETPVVLSESAEGMTNGEAWLVWDDAVGGYVLNVPEQNTLFGSQNVRVVATDAAGNAAEHNVEGFHISTNLFVRLFNSTWLIIVLLLVLLLAAGLIILLLIKRRRKANV